MDSSHAQKQDVTLRTPSKEEGNASKEDSLQTPTKYSTTDSHSLSLATMKLNNDDELSSFSGGAEQPPVPRRTGSSELLVTARKSPASTLQVPKKSSRPQLQSTPTTALSLTDIHTHSYADGTRETYAQSIKSTSSRKSYGLDRSRDGTEYDDSASVRSFVPGAAANMDAESILGDVVIADQQSPAWKHFNEQIETREHLDELPFDDTEPRADFNREFDELGEIDADGSNEGMLRLKAIEPYAKT